ncbi:ATP-dependent metallopeptidase FtsH/Yme1/Tma family protein [Amycolatopsis sp. NPDC049253]|uniref:ATP-dependent metallopeptidase FtsH/Yme1/Tma family protein n=1 Tax=Amycolatopsis sp. NPDC049253 TaxID=3155274 RepID=UPI003445B736
MIAAVATLVLIAGIGLWSPPPPALAYTELLSKVDADQVREIKIEGDGAVTGTLRTGTGFSSQLPTALGDTRLEVKLRDKNVAITGVKSGGTAFFSTLQGFLPFLLFFGFLCGPAVGLSARWAAARAGSAVSAGSGARRPRSSRHSGRPPGSLTSPATKA